jgi:hypothetical protein
MMRQDSQWNEPVMQHSVVAADARKLMSMVVTPVSVPRIEEHRHEEVDEHRQRWHIERQ